MAVRGSELIGMADFQRGFQQKRYKREKRQNGGKAEGGNREVFVVKHLDGDRHGGGEAADLARHDRDRALE